MAGFTALAFLGCLLHTRISPSSISYLYPHLWGSPLSYPPGCSFHPGAHPGLPSPQTFLAFHVWHIVSWECIFGLEQYPLPSIYEKQKNLIVVFLFLSFNDENDKCITARWMFLQGWRVSSFVRLPWEQWGWTSPACSALNPHPLLLLRPRHRHTIISEILWVQMPFSCTTSSLSFSLSTTSIVFISILSYFIRHSSISETSFLLKNSFPSFIYYSTASYNNNTCVMSMMQRAASPQLVELASLVLCTSSFPHQMHDKHYNLY